MSDDKFERVADKTDGNTVQDVPPGTDKYRALLQNRIQSKFKKEKTSEEKKEEEKDKKKEFAKKISK